MAGSKLEAVFFATERGHEPVREWLLSLTKAERKVIGDDVLKVQYCWPIGKPLVENLGNRLWEVRSRIGDRIARIVFLRGRFHDGVAARFHQEVAKDADACARFGDETDESVEVNSMKRKHVGTKFEDFLAEDGILEECRAAAIKFKIARELEKAMSDQNMSKTEIAKRLRTSRTGVDRLLDPKNTSITLRSMAKVANFLGKRIEFALR